MIPALSLLMPTPTTRPSPAAGDGTGFALTLTGVTGAKVAAPRPQQLAAPGNALPSEPPEPDPLAWLSEPPAAAVAPSDAAKEAFGSAPLPSGPKVRTTVPPLNPAPATTEALASTGPTTAAPAAERATVLDPPSTRPAPPPFDAPVAGSTAEAGPKPGRSAPTAPPAQGLATASDAKDGPPTTSFNEPQTAAPVQPLALSGWDDAASPSSDAAEAFGVEPAPANEAITAASPPPEPVIALVPPAPPPVIAAPAPPNHEQVAPQAIGSTPPPASRVATHRLAPLETGRTEAAQQVETAPPQQEPSSATVAESITGTGSGLALVPTPAAAAPPAGTAPSPASSAPSVGPPTPTRAIERMPVEPGPTLVPQPDCAPTAPDPARNAPSIPSGSQPIASPAREAAPTIVASAAPAVGPALAREPATPPAMPMSAVAATPAPVSPVAPPVAAVVADGTDASESRGGDRRLPGEPVSLPQSRPAPIAASPGRPISSGPASEVFAAALRRGARDQRLGPMPEAVAAALAPTPPTGAAAASPTPAIDMRQDRWPHVMVERIERLRDAADAADTRVRLVPDALGPVEVSVRREGEAVHVHFAAEQAGTRALLQDAAPRLAEAAEARGLKLGQVNVGGGQADANGGRQQAPAPAVPVPARPRRDAPAADPTDTRIA